MIVFIIIFIVLLVFDIEYDHRLMKKFGHITKKEHSKHTHIRVFVFIINAILLGVIFSSYDFGFWKHLLYIFLLINLQNAVWWILFDVGFNLRMGWVWSYMGDGKDWYEKFKSWKQQYIAKAVYLGIAVTALLLVI